jgi:hypothetical protein
VLRGRVPSFLLPSTASPEPSSSVPPSPGIRAVLDHLDEVGDAVAVRVRAERTVRRPSEQAGRVDPPSPERFGAPALLGALLLLLQLIALARRRVPVWRPGIAGTTCIAFFLVFATPAAVQS